MASSTHNYYSVTLIFVLFAYLSAQPTKTFPNVKFPTFTQGWAQRHFHERGNQFEGDIVLGDLRAGSDSARWRRALIPYAIHPSIRKSGREAIQLAMKDIEGKTCVRFKPRQERDKDFVRITSFSQGCFSYVGRDGGAQQLNLGPGCWHKTTIIHELMHAVGFWHEQSRMDRDKYINIHWNNINRSFWSQFAKHDRLNNFGTPYDRRSVMHYSYTAFAKIRGRPTITAKMKGFSPRLLGSGDAQGGLTETDALQINRMYSCTSTHKSSQ